MKKFFGGIALFIGCGLLAAATESFVLQKKPKKMTLADYKERCCQGLMDALTLTPESYKGLAEFQSVSMEALPDLLEDSFFKVSEIKLVEHAAQEIQKIYERQEKINELIELQLKSVKALKKEQK